MRYFHVQGMRGLMPEYKPMTAGDMTKDRYSVRPLDRKELLRVLSEERPTVRRGARPRGLNKERVVSKW